MFPCETLRTIVRCAELGLAEDARAGGAVADLRVGELAVVDGADEIDAHRVAAGRVAVHSLDDHAADAKVAARDPQAVTERAGWMTGFASPG